MPPTSSVMRQSISNFRLYCCSKKIQMLRKKVKLLLEQLQVCIFAKIVFGVRCTLKCLRRLLKIYWPMKVSKEEVRRWAKICIITEQIRRRRWCWIGHVLRMNNQQNPRIALKWASEGKRTIGWSKVTWIRTVEGERQRMGFATWSETVTAARDKRGLEETSQRPYSPRGDISKQKINGERNASWNMHFSKSWGWLEVGLL